MRGILNKFNLTSLYAIKITIFPVSFLTNIEELSNYNVIYKHFNLNLLFAFIKKIRYSPSRAREALAARS
jgi:hypothetical protein